MRIDWHTQAGEMDQVSGISDPAPIAQLILVAPAVQFHPANETILELFQLRNCRSNESD